ncbi:SDR family oxidoreductase [Streptomyces sp. NBC_01795]|uniref:SDR family NAD(P)-dependent oxidoreductase n=1 Tax=Streptomyces sp. NBC_01795 TaxID=2975943 RepID=UPI002DDB22CF|nr:SDR family oxidoreductase [Streptomyces sp. NBC_01795]WSA94828.1 SDR family oxidoreductase [Streptomyces sp. NBC_01795]
MRRFEGRVAFVTGGGHGIGAAVARRLADEGAAVAVTDIDTDAAGQVAQELTERGAPAAAYHCDVTRRDTVDGAVAEAARRFGRLDVLAHTVGHNLAGLAEEEPTDEQWARQYDFTLTGTVRCVRAALPKFAETGGGAVVLVGSMSGLVAFGTDPYAAAKAALGNLVRNLAARHGPDGVRVNMVVPGTVATRVWDDRPGALDELSRLYPLRRVGQPEDIAAAMAFLASDDAAWITGVPLPVEGGILTGPGHLIG